MSHDYSQFQEHAPAENILQKLAQAAREQRAAEKAVAEKELELENAKKELKRISEVVIPSLMDEAHMEEFTTSDGIKIKVDENVRASIPAAKAAEAFAWLRLHKHDGMIKHNFVVPFSKHETERAAAFSKLLADLDQPFEEKRSVHPSTLSSWVREMLEKGEQIPMETFGVFRQRVSKIEVKNKD